MLTRSTSVRSRFEGAPVTPTQFFAALFLLLGLAGRVPSADPVQLVVCGWDEVVILQVADEAGGAPRRLWSWRATGRADVPDEFEPLFRTTDECKPVDGGSKILITSSSGGVALVDRAADRVLFHARAANAHSAEMLPGNRVVVAASHDSAGRGDRLIVFDLSRPDHALWSGELAWAHGVVWDAQRNRLWAVGEKELRSYELHDWRSSSPSLRQRTSVPLTDTGGHDLSPVPGTPMLAVSSSTRCWLFDRDAEAFKPHPDLGSMPRVKSINHAPDGRVVYVQADADHWWTERIHFLHPSGYVHVSGEHFYKARWYAGTK